MVLVVAAAVASGHSAAARAGFSATRGAQLGIVIQDALSRRVSGAREDMPGGDGRAVAAAASDDDGRVSAKKIAVGTYAVVVRRGGFQDATSVVTVLCPPCRRNAAHRGAEQACPPIRGNTTSSLDLLWGK
jgi:hypothetical protein